jgi:hypothetical protein
LRDLGLARAASAELERVAALGEPGWSDEARALADGLRGPVAARDAAHAAFAKAEAAMLAGGAPIDPALGARFPGEARVDLHDALRMADSAAAAQALAPLAAAIDQATGGDGARRAVARVAAADFAARARFAPRYRQLVAGQLAPAAIAAFLDELDRAGPAVADLAFGAIVLAGQVDARVARLAALAAADGDPWFTTFLARAAPPAARGRRAGRRRGALRAALAACPPTVAYRCGGLGLDLASLYLDSLRLAEAEPVLSRPARRSSRPARQLLASTALAHLGDLERMRTRFGAMQAYLDEYVAAATRGLRAGAFAGQLRATAAYWQGDVAAARAALPAPDACGAAPEPPYVMVAVDLARFTGDAGDRARATTALAALAATDDPERRMIAQAGQGRLAIGADPAGGRAQLTAAIAAAAALPGVGNPAEFSAWAYSALVDDAGARGDRAQALADALAERGLADPGGCLLMVSLDDDRVTAVARGADGALRGHHARTGRVLTADADVLVPSAVRAALAACAAVQVIARPPLHGRADLLAAGDRVVVPGPRSAARGARGRRADHPRRGAAGGARPAAGGRPRRRAARRPRRRRRRGHPGARAGGDGHRRLRRAARPRPGRPGPRRGLVPRAVAGARRPLRADRRRPGPRAPDRRAHRRARRVPRRRRDAAGQPPLEPARRVPRRRRPRGDRRRGAHPRRSGRRVLRALRARLAAGATPAAAVAAERAAGPEPWRAEVMVFE